MNNPLRAGVVGLTGIGANRPAPGPGPGTGFEMPHSHVAAYRHVAGTEPVAVCDIVPEKLDDFHRTWSDALPDVRGYTDYREMLAREQLDVISVATPDDRHAQIVVDAVEAGVRGIICEKPIASTLADADRMIAAVEAAGIPMLVDHTRRWMFPWVQVAEVIASGEIGEVQRIVANQGGPRAMLFRNGTHMFDTILWFAGGTPTAVYAIAEAGFEDYPPRYASDGGHDPDTDPAMSVVVEFDNGVRAFWNMCKTMPQVFTLEVLGTAGIARVGDSGDATVTVKNGGDFNRRTLPRPQYTLGHIAGCVDEMVHLIHHGGQASMDGRTSRQVVEVLLAALHSQHAGNARITLPISDA
ncbi:MAG: Gfo/Idh/MocA family oxidoreductase [Chloroflexota bacterium]|nr:Gfo/Idh/MocA family oxidoreductase [Chloroflexota bacterium]